MHVLELEMGQIELGAEYCSLSSLRWNPRMPLLVIDREQAVRFGRSHRYTFYLADAASEYAIAPDMHRC